MVTGSLVARAAGGDRGCPHGFFHIICPYRGSGCKQCPWADMGWAQRPDVPRVPGSQKASPACCTARAHRCPPLPPTAAAAPSIPPPCAHAKKPMPRSPCHAPAPWPDPAAELARAALHRTGATHRVHASSTEPIPVEFPCPALRLLALPDTGVSLPPRPCPCSLQSLQRVTKKSPRLVPGGSWRAGL